MKVGNPKNQRRGHLSWTEEIRLDNARGRSNSSRRNFIWFAKFITKNHQLWKLQARGRILCLYWSEIMPKRLSVIEDDRSSTSESIATALKEGLNLLFATFFNAKKKTHQNQRNRRYLQFLARVKIINNKFILPLTPPPQKLKGLYCTMRTRKTGCILICSRPK